MIVNEIISNSFKYAFSGKNEGNIQIKLHTKEDTKAGSKGYVLNISDNGIGIPENIDFEKPDTLGLQLVNILVDQIDGYIELKREQGTEFKILFSNIAR
jgi:two-component sensor histidine kinase